MIGGPDIDLARGIPDFSTATTGDVPVVPAEDQGVFTKGAPSSTDFTLGAPSPDAFTLPGYSKSEQLQITPAQFAWQPSQADLGQGQVQASGFAEMKLPFGALASRGQSIAEREQANKQAQKQLKDKFDPYGGVGKAADPFQPAFGKYAMTTLNKLADDIIKAYGGDEEEGWKRIRTPGTQENQLWLQKSREISDVGTANQYEFGKYADLLAEIQIGKQSVSPETLKALKQFLSAQNENGVPAKGVDPGEFRSMRRDLEGMISMDQYMKEFMDKLPSQVQEVAQGLSEMGRARSIGGDRYAIEQEITKQFGPAIEQYAQTYSAMSGGRVSVNQAREKFRSVFNDARKSVIKDWSPRADSGGDGSQKTGPSASYGRGAVEGAGFSGEYDQVRLSKKTSGAGTFMPPIGFVDVTAGSSEVGSLTMHPEAVFEDNSGNLYISGKVGADPRAGAVVTDKSGKKITYKTIVDPVTGEERRVRDRDGVTETITEEQYFKALPSRTIPYEGTNAAVLEQATGMTEADFRSMIQEGRAKRGSTVSSPKASMVTVKLPDGTTGQIPADKLAAFKKKYPGATQVK